MTAGELLHGGSPPRPTRRRPMWPAPTGVTIGALAVVIALVMAGGVVAAIRLGSGGPQPEDVLPSTTFAMVRIDLDPPATQKLAVRALTRKFPDAPDDDLIGIRDALAGDAVEALGLDYDADVRPWLGDRYAVAAFDVAGDVELLVVVQTRDEARARRAVERADAGAGIAFLDGYALLGKSPVVVAAALDGARAGRLADTETFAADVASLRGDQIAISWVDVAAFYGKVLDDVVGDLLGDPAPTLDAEGVRVAAGLHATRSFIELETLVIGADPGPAAMSGDV